MKPAWLTSGCVLLGFLSAARGEETKATPPTRAQLQFFEKNIRPVLVDKCYECHSAQSKELSAKLRVDTREGLLKGGQQGAAVMPGDPENSLLIAALEYRNDLEMPPDGKLDEDVIQNFRRWVRTGAADPRDEGGETAPTPAAAAPVAETKPLWSLQPVGNPAPPVVSASDWPLSDIDRFVLARQEELGLHPVGDARPDALLRRLSFDLVGLPPLPGEVVEFEHAASRDLNAALEDVIDRLLASPQFGERWARHWLDAVRYGESSGNSRDVLHVYAWRYRDYVIDAFNADLPYDRFLAEQIAGDLLPAKESGDRERLQVATGLLAIGSKSLNGGNIELDIADDQIDVIGKAMLGLTISCARCHDHKFDPIPTADYYSLVGIFRSTETLYGGDQNRPESLEDKLKVYLPLGENGLRRAKEFLAVETEIDKLQDQKKDAGKEIARLEMELLANWERLKAWKDQRDGLRAGGSQTAEERECDETTPADKKPAADKPAADKKVKATAEASKEKTDGESVKPAPSVEQLLAAFAAAEAKLREANEKLPGLEQRKKELPEVEFMLAVRDASKIEDSPIHLRGERNKKGDMAPRGFLHCVGLADVPAIPADQSGRLQLAEWLTRPDHPLTPRVLVNRVWQHLFGRGLVESADNFGRNGSLPSHPELLDHLARRFVDVHHWSVKSLIREIVLTRTYRLSNDYDESNAGIDPANVQLWRSSRRRLEAEAIRDAMLAASGGLNLSRPFASPVYEIGEGEVGRNLNTVPLERPFPHRSIYLAIIRGIIPEVLRVFDFPEPSNPQGVRDVTNVPAQSLYLMNSPFVEEQSRKLAERLLAKPFDNDRERLEELSLACLGRRATEAEAERMLTFLTELGGRGDRVDANQRVIAWTALCQALFASAEFRYVE